MKKLLLFLFSLCFSFLAQAQVSKTVNLSSGGELYSTLSPTELATITNLTITGTIDARDFSIMRDNMPALNSIDLSGATIAAYTGIGGTEGPYNVSYLANGIPQYAFWSPYGSKKILTSFIIPPTVTTIGYVAFSETSLKSITIPASVNSVGGQAFQACNHLSSVILENGVDSLLLGVFINCDSLKSITLPTSLTYIDVQVFDGCTKLESISIPASVIYIGNQAFELCNNLASFTVDANNPNYSSADGILFNKNKTKLIKCPMTFSGSYTIPSTVDSVYNWAFDYCLGLTSITIPGSVKYIGFWTFSWCSGLTSVTIPSSVVTIDDHGFFGCSNLRSLNLSEGLKTIRSYAFEYCTSLQSVILPSTLNSTGDMAFEYCTGLTSVTIKSGVKKVGMGSFAYDYNLGAVSIPSTVTSIGRYAFSYCGLTSLTFEEGLDSIGSEAFDHNLNLSAINIPSTVTTIGESAFSECGGVFTVASGNQYFSSPDGVLFNQDQSSLIQCLISRKGSYTIPATVTSIGFGAFDYCANISTLKIPPSVKSIGSMALSCSGLTALYAYPIIPVDVSLSIGVFNNLNITQCSLYVPFGTLAAYQDAWGWQYFSPIVEMNGFALSDTAVSISYVEGSIASDSLTANVIWTATSDKTWLTVSPNMATTGNATLTFTAGVNTGEARKATVTVSSEDVAYPQIITIYQQSGGSASVSEVKENSNSIYPNPSHGLVNVCFYIPEPSRVRIDVLNLCNGDVLPPYISSKSSGENIVKFDLSRLPAGYYFVRILTKSGTQLRKLIIQ